RGQDGERLPRPRFLLAGEAIDQVIGQPERVEAHSLSHLPHSKQIRPARGLAFHLALADRKHYANAWSAGVWSGRGHEWRSSLWSQLWSCGEAGCSRQLDRSL